MGGEGDHRVTLRCGHPDSERGYQVRSSGRVEKKCRACQRESMRRLRTHRQLLERKPMRQMPRTAYLRLATTPWRQT